MSACTTCNVLLEDYDVLKDHYKSAFHQYNLKRRVDNLAPITLAAFDRQTTLLQKKQEQYEEETADCVFICDACHKKFYSEGQFKSHNSSKKHQETVRSIIAMRKAKAAAAAVGESVDGGKPEDPTNGSNEDKPTEESQEPIEITHENCVFCWRKGENLEENLVHMQKEHSFYVPDIEYCENLRGLVEYLHAKVIEGCYCLYCDNGKQFESPEAVRQHMKDKGHCLMRYDEDHHYEEFEDYYNYANSEDEEGTGPAEEAEGRIVVGSGGAFISDDHLVFPDGRIAYHRDVVRYLKQRFRLSDERKSVQQSAHRLALLYQQNGVASNGSHAQRQQQLSLARVYGYDTRGNDVDTHGQRKEAHRQRQNELRLGIAYNDIRTKHFRIQVMGAG